MSRASSVPPDAEQRAKRDRVHEEVRRCVLGGDRALRVIDQPPDDPPPPPLDDAGDRWPITPLGRLNGVFHFLDVAGEKRELTARQLGTRTELLALFGGSDLWLRANHPKRVANELGEQVVVDFKIADAAAALQRECFKAGLYGEHIQIRQPGVWRDADGAPVVHCGDQVMIGNEWYPAGRRQGNQIWAAAPATPRPGDGCSNEAALHLQTELRELWRWRESGAPIAILGLIANAYLCAALDWRPAAVVIGETASGKSSLLEVIRAALPLHHHKNDTTKAGIEQAVNGRAMPILIDEAADRANRSNARHLADLVLSAAAGEGTRGSRGTLDGRGRRIELAGVIIMFSINPPELEPQHLGRMTLLELLRPDDGADHRAQHRMLARYMRVHASSLWARALASWDRYQGALELFREGLREFGCAPREMDQAGALLAGWWILVDQGLPGARDVRAGISALHGGERGEAGLIRTAETVEADSGPQRMLQHLLGSMVYLHRSTDREPIGKLIEIALGTGSYELRSQDDATELLTHYGVKVVRKCERPGKPKPLKGCDCPNCRDRRGPVPRMSDQAGVWVANRHPEIARLFNGTDFDGDRWRTLMARLPSARRSCELGPKRAVRVGSVTGAAIWLDALDLFPADTEP
jgi:hypothetical protein